MKKGAKGVCGRDAIDRQSMNRQNEIHQNGGFIVTFNDDDDADALAYLW